jgi:transposase
MATGRPLVSLTLGAEQREQLQAWSRRAKTAQALAMRSRIVLLAADGLSNTEIARRQNCSLPTAGKWWQRFLDSGLDGLLDEPRPGTPRKLSDRQVELVLSRTLESQPEAATHWSTRDMARATGLSQSTISRIWRAFSLAPHRAETFKLSRDPLFIDKVRDIVGLYMNPPERALVLGVDEKSQIQALDRTAPLLPMRSAWSRAALDRLATSGFRSQCNPPSFGGLPLFGKNVSNVSYWLTAIAPFARREDIFSAEQALLAARLGTPT